jgi:hypothetical protein
VGNEEEAKWTGQRVRVVSTSFTMARSHCRRWRPDRAEWKVRGEPERSRLSTGAPAEETPGGKGSRRGQEPSWIRRDWWEGGCREGGHPLKWQRGKERGGGHPLK